MSFRFARPEPSDFALSGKSRLFKSFFLAGFECATGFNLHGQWIDQIVATHHDRLAEEDYGLLAEHGILATRDAVRWPIVNPKAGVYDFSSLDPIIGAANKFGIDVIWDLFHFGYPSDVDLFDESFPFRFSRYCSEAARYISRRTPGRCFFTPVNEPSFFAWAAGDAARFAPHQTGRSFELKVALIGAAIAGIDAIRKVCPSARFVNADALCRVVAPPDQPELEQSANDFNEHAVFQSWDMLAGRLMPELGGSPSHLDIVGINYYWTNQWELGSPDIPLGDDDPRCASFCDLLRGVWRRYGNEMLVSETSHVNEHRVTWLKFLTQECRSILDDEIPLHGVCLYPILGMPEWHAVGDYTPMGLWDLVENGENLKRMLYRPMAAALKDSRFALEQHACCVSRKKGSAGLL